MTLTGPGGVGKTRLALELAHAAVAKGGLAWWVDLVPVPPPRVAEAVAGAAGVEIVPGRDPVGALCAALAPSQGLLVLDNAEHVLDPVAELAERLVAEAPGIVVLVTSRERLALDQEAVRTLPPLPVPVGADATSPSVRLFLARAGALPELRRRATAGSRSSPRCAGAWTGCRWPSSSAPPAPPRSGCPRWPSA